MTDTYYAVFIGGPEDATALKLSKEAPPTLYLPTRKVETTPLHKISTASYTHTNELNIAVYHKHTIVELDRVPTETKVRFYFFSGLM